MLAYTVVLNFTPSWFAINMGTGIVSILLHTAPHKFPGMERVANVFYLGNCALFVVFLFVTVARYICFPWVFTQMLRHTAQSMFIGTLPMGLATIVNATVLMAVPSFGTWARDLAWVLWWSDVVLTIASCFGVPFVMFHLQNLALDQMTAAWLLPIVPAVVAGASGGLVATSLDPINGLITLIISYVLWGIGMGLSFLVMALYMQRLIVHKLPPAEVIVSAFLPLGPLGQGAYGLIIMSTAGKTVFPATNFLGDAMSGQIIHVSSVLSALILWGLGIWWLVHGVSCVVVRYSTNTIVFNMGFWGFIFPIGVFTAATIALADVIPSAFLGYLSMVLLVLLFLLWLGVAYGTIHGALNKSLLVAPCLSQLQHGNLQFATAS